MLACPKRRCWALGGDFILTVAGHVSDLMFLNALASRRSHNLRDAVTNIAMTDVTPSRKFMAALFRPS